MNIEIRSAEAADGPELVALSAQLGYPVSEARVANWILEHGGDPDEKVFVASGGGRIVGWTSVAVADHFYASPCAEISGLVVDEGFRGRGIGRALVAEAEKWAREKGLETLRLRANAVRTEAHKFYLGLGFKNTKQQLVFVKSLAR